MATDVTRAPTSDDAVGGTVSGSAGTRYTNVDDYPTTTGDSLQFGTTASSQITFGFSSISLPAGASSIVVYVEWYDAEPSSGTNRVYARLKVEGSYYDHSSYHNPSGTSYTSRSYSWSNNPKSGTSWTVADINGTGSNDLQAFGVDGTDSNPVWTMACIQLRVNYIVDWPGSATIRESEVVAVAATLNHASWAAEVEVEEYEAVDAAATLNHAAWPAEVAIEETEAVDIDASITVMDWPASSTIVETEAVAAAATLNHADWPAAVTVAESETVDAEATLNHADWPAAVAIVESETVDAEATLNHADWAAATSVQETETVAVDASITAITWPAAVAIVETETVDAEGTLNHADWPAAVDVQETEAVTAEASLTHADWPAETAVAETEVVVFTATLTHADWAAASAIAEFCAVLSAAAVDPPITGTVDLNVAHHACEASSAACDCVLTETIRHLCEVGG